MGDYKYNWEVKCPRCEVILRSEDTHCPNCNKSKILVDYYQSMNTPKQVSLGCPVCNYSFALYSFKCSSCGTIIDNAKSVTVELPKSFCFVATVAFENENHIIVNELRYTRDNLFMKTKRGRNFVEWYYRRGPLIATYIKDKPILKFVIRVILTQIGHLSIWTRKIFNIQCRFKHNKI